MVPLSWTMLHHPRPCTLDACRAASPLRQSVHYMQLFKARIINVQIMYEVQTYYNRTSIVASAAPAARPAQPTAPARLLPLLVLPLPPWLLPLGRAGIWLLLLSMVPHTWLSSSNEGAACTFMTRGSSTETAAWQSTGSACSRTGSSVWLRQTAEGEQHGVFNKLDSHRRRLKAWHDRMRCHAAAHVAAAGCPSPAAPRSERGIAACWPRLASVPHSATCFKPPRPRLTDRRLPQISGQTASSDATASAS